MLTITCPSVRVVPGGIFQASAAISLLVALPLCIGGLRIALDTPFVLMAGGAALAPYLLHRISSAPSAQVPVVVREGHLQVGDRRVAIGQVAGAFARTDHAIVVELVDRTRIDLELAPETRAEEVLAAFGWDPARRTLRAPLRGQLGAFTVGFLSFVFAMFPAMFGAEKLLGAGVGALLCAFVASAVASAGMIRLVAKPHVVIGTDGVRVVRGPGRERFIPYAAVARVEAHASLEVELTLARDETVWLPTLGQDPAQVKELAARIEAGRAAAVAQGAGLASVLERGGRPFSTWMKDLGGVAHREAGFRSTAISPSMLERELADTTAPAERRLAAAIALRGAPDADAARVRVAAETCADPELRAALDAVCDGALDEDMVERAGRRRGA